MRLSGVIAAIFAFAIGGCRQKTSWGDPDLQGLWTNASLTQLERPLPNDALIVSKEEASKRESWGRQQTEEILAQGYYYLPDGNGSVTPKRMVAYNDFWADVGEHLAAINGQIRTSWIVDPPDGRIPYSQEGRAQLLKKFGDLTQPPDNPEDIGPPDRCLIGVGFTSGPPMLNVYYNNYYQIVQSPGFVAIMVEMVHDVRIIRLDGGHLPESMRPWMGDSIGHWEGDTLVAETTNQHPGQNFSITPINQKEYIAPNAKITEWFTRLSKDEILYRFRVEEPGAYTRPWLGEMIFRSTKGPMYEYACHEGNRSVTNILAGARYGARHKERHHD
jgi:hypothetical protein